MRNPLGILWGSLMFLHYGAHFRPLLGRLLHYKSVSLEASFVGFRSKTPIMQDRAHGITHAAK